MDKNLFLLVIILLLLFSCGINEADKYYSVSSESKRIYRTGNNEIKNFYCKVSKIGDKIILHIVDDNGMGDVYMYPEMYKENNDTSISFGPKSMMPYSHRMYFLKDSLLRKEGEERLGKFNQNSILKYSEAYSETGNGQFLSFSARSEHYKERSIHGQIIVNKDYIVYKKSTVFSGGIFYIDSLNIVARPISSFRKKVQINSLIEANCTE